MKPLLSLLAFFFASATALLAAETPNIIVIMADDLGFRGVSLRL